MSISALVLTCNEEKSLPRLLKSLFWVDEIIIIDSGSSDRTLEIAKQYKAKIFSRILTDFSSQWNAGLEHVTSDWVMIFDADEEVPEAMADHIRTVCDQASDRISGYRILRRNYVLGKWLRYGQQYGKKIHWYDWVRIRRGFNPGDYIGGAVKLFRTQGAIFENLVHEEVKLPSGIEQLQVYVNHYTADSIRDIFDKVSFYTSLHAQQIFDKNPMPPKFFYRLILWEPLKTFIKAYVRKCGFRDGFPGLVRCLADMSYEFLKNIKLYDYYWGKSCK